MPGTPVLDLMGMPWRLVTGVMRSVGEQQQPKQDGPKVTMSDGRAYPPGLSKLLGMGRG